MSSSKVLSLYLLLKQGFCTSRQVSILISNYLNCYQKHLNTHLISQKIFLKQHHNSLFFELAGKKYKQ